MYPMLARLETAGVVESWWAWSDEPGPRRRRYRLVDEPVDYDITRTRKRIRERIPLNPALALVLRMAS
jgi:DNA-binding PadR family transcriptional regulator